MVIDQQEIQAGNDISAAKDVIAAFLTSMKNYDLYPPDHSLSQKFLKIIHNRLEDFLSRYGELKIVIEQKRLLYKTVPIYEAESADDNFAFILYRDGLLWIEFLSGLTLEEIRTFFSILNKYKVLHDEPEDDIVTSLWDENMAHVIYEAKELFFEDVPLLDFSMLNKVPAQECAEAETEESPGPAPDQTGNILDMVSPEEHLQLWSLLPQEHEKLLEMVLEAEKSVRKGDVLQALFFVLTKQENPEDFAVVLDFLKEEWREAIENGKFARVTHHLTVLKKLKESPQQGREWIVELLARFFEDISDVSVLSSLKAGLAHLNVMDQAQLAKFRDFLLQLEPKAIISLGNLFPSIKNQEVLDVLFIVMAKLGTRDVAPLAELLANEDERIAMRAILILGKIKGEGAAKLIAQSLQHSSAKVRRQALRSYIEAGSPSVDKIFNIIDDPDLTTRSILLSFLGRERNEKVETLLLNYLKSGSRHDLDENHVHACYMALGLCGSKRSIPFLEKTLLGMGWKSIMKVGNTEQQQGAITALSRLQIEEATNVLKKGAASLLPFIRNSCRSALAENSEGA